MSVDPDQVILSQGLPLRPGAAYPAPLDPELAAWYLYPVDSGHSVLVAVAALVPQGQEDGDVSDYLVPAPVRMVQRVGWRRNSEGFLISQVPYDHDLGLVSEPGDDEH